MVFTMPVSPSAERAAIRHTSRWVLCALALWLGGSAAFPARADVFAVRRAETLLVERVFHLKADINFQLSADTLEALDNGVPLTVDMDIEIRRQRQLWWDALVAGLELRFQLQYHALTQQYLVRNLNTGVQDSYPTLATALARLGQIRMLPLLDESLVEPEKAYYARLRVQLDIEALPAPLRPLAYLSSGWRLSSDWYTWSLTI